MAQLTSKTENTYLKLKTKAKNADARMPSVSEVEAALTEMGIAFTAYDSVNVVERKTAGRRYVNSRHLGKKGRVIEIKAAGFKMDTSESYYSVNTWGYAHKLVSIIDNHMN